MKHFMITTLLLTTVLPVVAEEMVDLPVPSRSLPKGTVIKESMLTERSYPEKRVNYRMVDTKDGLVGMQTTRTLRAQAPILANTLRLAPEVEQNAKVSMSFQIGALKLRGLGRAMEDGHTGDVIRVMNVDSNKIVYAEVVGKGQVVPE